MQTAILQFAIQLPIRSFEVFSLEERAIEVCREGP